MTLGATIEEQLEHETNMVARGASTYLKNQRKMEEAGYGSGLDYSNKLMQEFMVPLVDALKIELEPGPGKYGRAKALIRRVQPEQAMYIAMRGLFNSFTLDHSITKTANKIGGMVESEARFSRFQILHGEYYDAIIKDFKRKGTQDFRHMHRVLTHSANEQNDEWINWTASEKVDVGMRLLDIILMNTDLVNKKVLMSKGQYSSRLEPTESCKAWIDDHESIRQLLFPDRCPCIIPPDEWTGINQGGYYSPQLRQMTPMIKASGAQHRKLLKSAKLNNVMEALNIAQSTPWAVNEKVLQIVRAVWSQDLRIGMPGSVKLSPPPCPIEGMDKATLSAEQLEEFSDWKCEAAEVYTQEKERISKGFQTTRIIKMANEYSNYSAFWYVWYSDFRGRMYTATSGFSPQGPDLAKGLLKFYNAVPLGERGYYWLCVHGANKFGYDKVSYDDRYAWVQGRHHQFMQAAEDPLSYREVWGNADKPYQFLAFLFEYRAVHEMELLGIDRSQYNSHLPLGQDGTCNGLQNFSAMLCDARGGAATNLVPSDTPADIYSEVASVCYTKVKALALQGNVTALMWIAFCDKYGNGSIPRSMAKRPVMTMPYGSTQQSCTSYLFNSILEFDRNWFKSNFGAARWLTPLMWEAIGDVVVAARAAMKWLQQCSSAMSRENKPIVWQTADGFVVVQAIRRIEALQIKTQLSGVFKVRVGDYTDQLDPIRQRNAVSPNFVHSMDATHLRVTIRLAKRMGINDLALIHDDYGAHAGNIDKLNQCIRAAFVAIYADGDPLRKFKEAQEASGIKMPLMPTKGTLNVRDVMISKYFFG